MAKSRGFWTPGPDGLARSGMHYIPPGRPILVCEFCGARVVHVQIPPRDEGLPPTIDQVDYPLENLNQFVIGDGWGRQHKCA